VDECKPLSTGFNCGGDNRDTLYIRGRGLISLTSQLNLSRFGHTSPCPPV